MADSGEDIATVFEDLGDLEKDFAMVELDARKLRQTAQPVHLHIPTCKTALTIRTDQQFGARSSL